MGSKDLLIEKEAEDDRLPWWRKVCFAVGGAPYQMTNTVINFFLTIFLLEVAEMQPYQVSIVVFVGKVWDAITDPTCGFLVSRTETRLGKYRPWILFSAPLACTAYFFLWYVPDFTTAEKVGWYLVFYCLFQGLLSGLHVPYTSLTMCISNSQKERDSATTYRMISEATGILVSVVVQGQLVNRYRIAGDCDRGTGTPSPQQLEDQKFSYIVGSLVVIGIYILCSLIVFFGVKEKKGVVEDQREGFYQSVKLVFSHGPFVKLTMSFLFLSLAVAIVQGNLALFVTHALGMADQFANFILVLLVAAILCMPLWHWVMMRFGKRTAYAAGMIILIPPLFGNLYVTDNIYIYYALVFVAGLAVAVSLLLPWSMLPDVLDDFMLKHGTRKDPIFYSFYVFFNKLAVGIGLGISQLALEVGGYQSGVCSQPASVGLALRMLIVPGPIVFILIALMFLWSYPIDEQRRKEMKKQIEELRNSAHEGSRIKQEEVASVSYQSIVTEM